MATTTGGSTYVTSTDLVADYPTASLALANRVDVVASGSMSKKTASYTVTVADILAGTTICMNSASATVITLPSTSLVNGMTLNVYSVNTGAVTFTGGTVTGTVNSITTQYTGVSLQYDSAAAVWWCLPFSAGVVAANFTNTATATYTGYKAVRFTGNGTLTIDKAGLADIFIAGGGGGGGSAGSGGGAGAYFINAGIYLPAGSYTVTIGGGGAGGAGGTNNPGTDGGDSHLSGSITLVGMRGGKGAGFGSTGGGFGNNGGSGGGSSNGLPGYGVAFQGWYGGSNTAGSTGSGGGGASAAGISGGAGGAGSSNTYATGTSTTYCGGGGGGINAGGAGGAGGGGAGSSGGAGTAGTANTGGGGGGGGGGSAAGGAGGSGVLIVRVAI